MRNFAAAVFLLLSTTSYGQSRAWVRIQTDYGMGARIDTVRFIFSDGYTPQTINSTADENGVFLAGFEISNSTDILWSFRDGKALPLIITPSDTIHITINSETDGVLFGKRARTCANLMDMYEAPNRPRVQAFASEYKRDPDDFVAMMDARLADHLRFANRFCNSTKCTKTFVTWYLKSAYVSYYRNLADYVHHFQKSSYADVAEMNAFLRARDVIVKAIDLNDPTLEMSSGYYDLLKSIFTLYVTPQELRKLYYTKSNWKSIDPEIQERLAEIKDQDVRKVIFGYYKGIRNWI